MGSAGGLRSTIGGVELEHGGEADEVRRGSAGSAPRGRRVQGQPVGCSAAGSEVVHEEGSSLRASEARDHTRAAVRQRCRWKKSRMREECQRRRGILRGP